MAVETTPKRDEDEHEQVLEPKSEIRGAKKPKTGCGRLYIYWTLLFSVSLATVSPFRHRTRTLLAANAGVPTRESFKRQSHSRSALLHERTPKDNARIERTTLLKLLLNDRTIGLSSHVKRSWLEYQELADAEKPNTKLVLTDIGWNHPNQTRALNEFPRSIRSRELLQAFVDHPDFDPTFQWSDMVEGKTPIDETVQYVVMMDIETCFDDGYPNFKLLFQPNADTEGGRTDNDDKEVNPCRSTISPTKCDGVLQSLLEAPVFQQGKPPSTLLFFDCAGGGLAQGLRTKRITSPQLSVLATSAGPRQLREDAADMGFPPPALKRIQLSEEQEQAIRTCESDQESQQSALAAANYRPYLFSFIGTKRPGSPRKALLDLGKKDKSKDVVLLSTSVFKTLVSKNKTDITYESLIEGSQFAATPRGMSRFSYRFTEVLSAGAIPVVHADGWVLPFRKELIDWSRCAVVIPEDSMDETIPILRQISPEKRCQMRRYCYEEIYKKYLLSPSGEIRAILDSLGARERAREGEHMIHSKSKVSLLAKLEE